MSQAVTQSWGSNWGTPLSLQSVKSLGLRTGLYVDAILLNGELYGGRGGEQSRMFDLEKDEYITEVVIRSGKWMDYLSLTTNKGNKVSGGGGGGNLTILKNIRVLEIGGCFDGLIRQLTLKYVENYVA